MLGLERDMMECDQCGSVYSIIAESDEMDPIFCPFCGDDSWIEDDDTAWGFTDEEDVDL